jgi:Tol biopolymer transport system component
MRPSRIAALVLATALTALIQGCDGSTEPQPQPVINLKATTSTSFTGTVGTDVQPAPSVRATNELGQPVQGVTITFKVVSGGGTIGGGTVTTADDGAATLGKWTLGTAAGTQTVSAGVADEPAVTFTALATAGPVAQITPSSGNNQLAGVGQTLEQRLEVMATDAYSNPVAGAPVVFWVTSGGGSIAEDPVLTDSTGTATATPWTLGAEAGVQQVAAASGAAHAAFRAFAAPQPGNLEGKLAFLSYSEATGGTDIAIMNADGTGFTRLSNPNVYEYGETGGPSWSPDGSQIVFSSVHGGYEIEGTGYDSLRIGLMTAAGANLTWLTEGPLDRSPAWSPDGTTIAFMAGPDIAVLKPVQGSMLSIVSGVGGDKPSWSPDGRRLAFGTWAGGGWEDIYTVNADGTGLSPLTHDMNAFHPAWSPDGSLIAFVHGDAGLGDAEYHVAVMAADGTFLKDLASAGTVSIGIVPGSIAWSPDGSGIAYSHVGCEMQGAGCSPALGSIKYVSLDGSRQETIVANGRSPSWHR